LQGLDPYRLSRNGMLVAVTLPTSESAGVT
jgi:hypothetical protein